MDIIYTELLQAYEAPNLHDSKLVDFPIHELTKFFVSPSPGFLLFSLLSFDF